MKGKTLEITGIISKSQYDGDKKIEEKRLNILIKIPNANFFLRKLTLLQQF